MVVVDEKFNIIFLFIIFVSVVNFPFPLWIVFIYVSLLFLLLFLPDVSLVYYLFFKEPALIFLIEAQCTHRKVHFYVSSSMPPHGPNRAVST